MVTLNDALFHQFQSCESATAQSRMFFLTQMGLPHLTNANCEAPFIDINSSNEITLPGH